MMKHIRLIRYIFLLMALFLAPVSSSAIGVAEDLVRAGMFRNICHKSPQSIRCRTYRECRRTHDV